MRTKFLLYLVLAFALLLCFVRLEVHFMGAVQVGLPEIISHDEAAPTPDATPKPEQQVQGLLTRV